MKVLVFAHTPPPLHGQSYMVQLMLEGFGGDYRKGRRSEQAGPTGSSAPQDFGIECYHVNARLSHNLEDIGDVRFGKFILLLIYCLQAIWCRFRYGVTNFYYVPAPGKRSALYRDWLVMFICRPFFKQVILHWHAAGLAKWLETVAQIRSRSLTYRLVKPVDLSIVLSSYNRADGEKLLSRNVKVVGNGIPDPCPAFEREILPLRQARSAARQRLLTSGAPDPQDAIDTAHDPRIFRVLFLAHCTREKGLFDSIDAVAIANQRLTSQNSPLRLHLDVAGHFIDPAEQSEFESRLRDARAAAGGAEPWLGYKGFVFGETKNKLLTESDCFCFPTYYYAESFGLVLVEAMAFGLPIVTTRWRSIPELLPSGYPGLVAIRSPAQIADHLLQLLPGESGEGFRNLFLRHFTLENHLKALAAAFHSVETREELVARTHQVTNPP